MGQTRHLPVVEKDGWIWVNMPDTINMDNSRKIEDDIEELLTVKGARIVLDMRRLEYLYSSAMGLMIRLQRKVKDADGVVCLVNAAQRIRTLLQSVNLDKLFPIYATDVEFEISRDEVWQKRISEDAPRFICVTQMEQNVCRINLSGHMTAHHNISQCALPKDAETAKAFVFDLNGLESIDSYGLHLLQSELVRIREIGKKAVAYGAQDMVKEILEHMGILSHLVLCADEREAMTAALRP